MKRKQKHSAAPAAKQPKAADWLAKARAFLDNQEHSERQPARAEGGE